MKKILCVLLLLVLAISITIPVSAAIVSEKEDPVHYGINEIKSEEIQRGVSRVVNIPEDADDDVVHYGINEIQPEDIIKLTPTPVDVETKQGLRESYVALNFANTKPNAICSDMIEHIVQEGDSLTLKIKACTWSPEQHSLEIGIYNWSTAENWYVTKTGGAVTDWSNTFRNLTAGNYSVYIRNCGSGTLISGYMQYNLS